MLMHVDAMRLGLRQCSREAEHRRSRNAAENGGGWLLFARIGMLRALNGDARGR